MAVLQRNSFEGGSPGQAITVANSGGANGDPFGQVTGNPTYNTSQAAHGSQSMLLTGNAQTVVFAMGGAMEVATRCYIRLIAQPTAAGLFTTLYTNNGTTYAQRALINANRQVAVQNQGGTQVAGGSAAWTLALDTWYRFEMQVTVGVGANNAGKVQVQLFVGDDTTPIASYTNNSNATTGQLSVTSAVFGRVSGTGWTSGPHMDDVAAQDQAAAIGPAAQSALSRTGRVSLDLTPKSVSSSIKVSLGRIGLGFTSTGRSSVVRQALARIGIGVATRAAQTEVDIAAARPKLNITVKATARKVESRRGRVSIDLTIWDRTIVVRSRSGRLVLDLRPVGLAIRLATRKARVGLSLLLAAEGKHGIDYRDVTIEVDPFAGSSIGVSAPLGRKAIDVGSISARQIQISEPRS